MTSDLLIFIVVHKSCVLYLKIFQKSFPTVDWSAVSSVVHWRFGSPFTWSTSSMGRLPPVYIDDRSNKIKSLPFTSLFLTSHRESWGSTVVVSVGQTRRTPLKRRGWERSENNKPGTTSCDLIFYVEKGPPKTVFTVRRSRLQYKDNTRVFI